ncbi:MAG: type II toxin-antitoxin system RelE/ParE family toxin [Acidobacteria bacterium]|nr:type II toxin-antitoxin system RelE/ParE family toxin [Acidobacteriota bacterium]
MEVPERDVEYYNTEDGRQPFRDSLHSLRDREGRRKIWARIDRVSLGNLGYCASVGEGVMELKIEVGPGYRVYFGQVGKKLVILLCGGDKSTQKSDIRAAHKYWADYWRHHVEG